VGGWLRGVVVLVGVWLVVGAVVGVAGAVAGQGLLGDGRMYELATPAQKNGALLGALEGSFIKTQVSEDGAHVIADSGQCFGGSPSCVLVRDSRQGAPYEFERLVSGWVARPLSPGPALFEYAAQVAFNVDAGTAMFAVPGASEVEDFVVRAGGGAFLDVGPLGEPPVSASLLHAQIATADLRHLVYQSERVLWKSLDPTASSGHLQSVYEYEGTGNTTPRLVGIAPGSGVLASECGTEIGGENGDRFNALSEDGETVYFTASPCEAAENHGRAVTAFTLYARYEHARSELISGPAPSTAPVDGEGCNVTCQAQPAGDANFLGAGSDGSKVFFTDPHQLTDSASEDTSTEATNGEGREYCHRGPETETASGCNLYVSECPGRCTNPAERRLVDVSAGDTSVGGPRPRVLGALAISNDGSHVYFVAQGTLTGANSEGNEPVSGEHNLYVYERDPGVPAGRLKFIATLSSADEAQWSKGVGRANVTPDGRFLVFTSHRALTPDDTRPEGPAQVYRYDAQDEQLVRVSIGAHGYANDGNEGTGQATIALAEEGLTRKLYPLREDPSMSDDGSYVFFESPSALTPGAVNDAPSGLGLLVENVYAYHEGEVSLISSGKDTSLSGEQTGSAVKLVGSDSSGRNVFFTTNESLIPSDTNTQRDYYDARLCTTTEPCLESPPPAEPCSEETCHPETPPTSHTAPIASTSAAGPGNLPPLLPTPTVTILSHTTHNNKITLHITIPNPGRITITSPSTQTTTRTITKPTTTTITITLTKHATHTKHTIKPTLHITYTPNNNTPTTTTTTLTIKPPHH
jgi:hypothetical protein